MICIHPVTINSIVFTNLKDYIKKLTRSVSFV